MKKIRGDKPIEVIIHIYMEISQGNSLCNYIYLKQTKMSCFSFIFSLFSSEKLENSRAGASPTRWKKRLAPVGGGK
jgi:hypothetical protein